MKITKLFLLFVILLGIFLPNALAEEFEDHDVEWIGFEAEELLNLGSAILATILFILVNMAYNRSNNKRLLYVSAAFFLFAIKGFLDSHELFMVEISWFEPLASILTFAILLCFFLGVIKK